MGLQEAVKIYVQARASERNSKSAAKSLYRKATDLITEDCPYPHPFYRWAALCMTVTTSYFATEEETKADVRTAYAVCKKGMAMLKKTTWMTDIAKRELQESFDRLLRDIESEMRILKM